ncbi:MAG: response regulator transcription factor [Acidimicrobiaceae bacterium]|nr:response regulator transcription factor [Acidimicrobiaceae bacterium]
MIEVLIADDQPMIRSGFRLILESAEDISVIGEAGDGREAVELAKQLSPDVIVMDIRMPNLDGIAATRLIDNAKVLILTTFHLDNYVVEALAAGASGFLLKDATADELKSAIRSIARGDAALSPSVTRTILDIVKASHASRLQPPSELSTLSARESDVLKCLALGMSNHEIGASLYLSEATVKTHVSRILAKLGLRDRVQAVVFAYRYGVLEG